MASDASSSTYGVSFESFDAAFTSALDVLDGAAESLFGDDGVSASERDAARVAALAWRALDFPRARARVRAVVETLERQKHTDGSGKKALKEALSRSDGDAAATRAALLEEVRRVREQRDDIARDVAVICAGLMNIVDPTPVLERARALHMELEATKAERDLARANAATDAETSERSTAKKDAMKSMEDAMKVMESKTRAAENAADGAREGKARVERDYAALRRLYDEAQTRVFELEESNENAIAREKIEREELRKFTEAVRAREEAMEAMEAKRSEDAERAPGEADSMRERLAVKERLIAELAKTIEDAEKSATARLERAMKDASEANRRCDEMRIELNDVKARASRAEREDVAASMATSNNARDRVSDDIEASEDALDGASVGIVAMSALRERNKKLAAEVIDATRDKEEAVVAAALATSAAAEAERKCAESAAMVSTLEMELSQKLERAIEAGAGASEADLLAILTAQRDRFKRRTLELDERSSRLERERIAAEDARAKLNEDNVALVEKLAFVQNYYAKHAANGKTTILRVDDAGLPAASSTEASQSHTAKQQRYSCGGGISLNVENERSAAVVDGIRRRAARYGCFGPGGSSDDVPGGEIPGGVISRYRKKYLAKLNPFAAFRDTAADDSASLLPLHDRIALGSGKMLMTSRTTRLAFATYVVVLHCVLFLRIFT